MSTSPKLMAKICHYYYRERLTMAQIGSRLAMSRHRVGRLLREAEECGIVRISIATPFTQETRLEQELESALGLKSAITVDVEDLADPAEIKSRVCAAGAELVRELIQPGNTVGIGWGSTTFEVVNRIEPFTVADVNVVQITGGNKALASDFDCQEVTRRLAGALNVAPVLLHAPCVVDRPETRQLLMQDSTVRHALAYFDTLDIAIVGIGSLVPTLSSTLIASDYIPAGDLDRLREDGAVGDVFSYFLDAEGALVASPIYERLITISEEHIRRVPTLLGIGAGSQKARAVVAAARGGFVNTLVIDSFLARAVLKEAGAGGDLPSRREQGGAGPAVGAADPVSLERKRSDASCLTS